MTDLVRVSLVPADLPAGAAAGLAGLLDASERSRAAALLSAEDRQLFTVAHGVLRILAARELNVRPAALSWVAGRYGKPELVPPWSGLHTSLSHSGGLIAAAVSTARPVGVDIQHLEPSVDTAGLSARFFPPDEAGYVAAGGDACGRADRLARLWVRKEAVVKAAGSRLWPNLKVPVRDRDVVSCAEPASAYRVAEVSAPAGYRAAVALAGAAPFVLAAAGWPSGEVTSAMVS
ncbi:MAG TPA: 4'-phosphopantetheinyl transferase superfamily protein [Streptosporangiaceae bacterium]